MHDTASRIGSLAIEHYLAPGPARILEVGSYDVNGSLRAFSPERAEYVGLDVEEGHGVDLVVEPGGPFPVEDGSFDLVLATSALEHDPAFWNTFLEMGRKLRDGGYLYINVPSNGAVHRYPQDAWRFYPDSGRALAAWAQSQGLDIHLVESFTAAREQDIWNDFVAVFRKSPRSDHAPAALLHEQVSSANVWLEHGEHILREASFTEDMTLLQNAVAGRAEVEAQLGEARQTLDAERAVLAGLEHELAAARTEVATLLGRLGEVQSEVVQRQEEIAQITAEHDHTRAERDHARAELELSRAAVVRLREELSEANGWVFRLAGERQEAEARCERLGRDLERVERLYQSEAKGHARSVEALEQARQREQALTEAQAAERARLEAMIQTLDRGKAELQDRLVDLDGRMDELSRQARELEDQVEFLGGENHRLGQAHAGAVAAGQHAQALLGQRYQEIATLSTLLVSQEGVAAQQAERAEWLRQVTALSLVMPFWWRFLPTAMRRKRELRRLARRGLFDAQRYYDLHPDVREAGMDPLQHYILHGLAEGRAV
ncbi:methyltransferase domain-containing protein [Novosphingobium flavum]|nr:methyltransferase domain-containing protein [Novosphingobium aerophilum]MBC2661993.1 methyltransferase domain-containing protein [Novosphingobium aerophilum]